MKKQIGIIGLLLAVVLVMLACQTPMATPTQDTQLIQTQTSLAMTLAAVNNLPPTATMQPTATKSIQPTDTPANTQLTQTDIQAKINSANILVYEDAAGVGGTLRIVSKALENFGSHNVYVGDAIGNLMLNMESPTKWDLIIIASEFRNSIQGNFWAEIQRHVDNDPSALITELWYLDKINEYDIKPFMDECGIAYQKNWSRGSGFNQIDYEMFWSEPDSPVFNTPNTVDRFRFALRSAKIGDVGDFVKLTGNTDATILASRVKDNKSDMGLLTSCVKGTVLVQTFKTHDYPSDEMISLWQNYITYTLTNHFMNAR